jgi:cytochrome b
MMRDDGEQRVKVWDGGVRLFHWTLVVLFVLSAYSALQDKFGIYADIHLYSGVAMIALVSWRILWGLVGSDTARFGRFVKGPRDTAAYLRDTLSGKAYDMLGHNPLGALSVCLMLLLLLAQAVMGLFASDDMFFEGPMAGSVDSGLSGTLTGIHETLGFVLFGLVGLHILVILLYAGLKKVNLVAPMITGWKRTGPVTERPAIGSPLLALGLFAAVGASVWYLILV